MRILSIDHAALFCLAVFLHSASPAGAAECLQQKALPDGCVQTGGAIGCTPATQTTGTNTVDISPDGKSVFVSTFSTDTLVLFDRDTTTGVLTPVAGTAGCFNDSGSGG